MKNDNGDYVVFVYIIIVFGIGAFLSTIVPLDW